MRKSLWIALGVILALVLGVVAAACGGGSSSATTSPTAAGTQSSAPTGPIKIGIAISLTGDSAAPCQQIKEGFDTEAKYINDNGGINGRQVQLVYADDQSKMDTAMAAVQSLVDQKCDVIIGPFPQWTEAPTFPITNKAGILQIAFGPPTDAFLGDSAKYKLAFMPATGSDGCADAFVKEMQADGRKNVVGVGDQMVISQETLKRLNTLLPQAGIKFTYMKDSYSLSETDFGPIANKIAAEVKQVKPDAIILCSNPVAVNPLIKALKALGVTQPIYNQGSGAHPLPMFAPAGNNPANVAGDYAIGPAIVDPSQIPDSYPAKQDLIAYIQRWKAGAGAKEPFASLFLGFAYDTIHLAEQAIKTATTQDGAGYAAALEKVDWWGAQGHYKFSPTDHIGNHGGFFQWQYTMKGFKFIRDLNAIAGQ